MRVCIVDDNDLLGDSLAYSLRDRGFDVRVARDGRSGVELARDFKPQLVLVDWRMPGMRGDEVVAALRAEHPETFLVLMSGGASRAGPGDLDAARAMADAFLEKPFTPGQLMSAIDDLKAGRRSS